MRKIALGVEYSGTQYYGWQSQSHLPTIQGFLELALSQIAAHPIKVFCAGRTDAGVHAFEQVVHFETSAVRNPQAWTLGVNTQLPKDIAVRWMQSVDSDFHARFSATARRYQYIIYNGPSRPALMTSRATWIYYPLDVQPMQFAAQYLIGEHDFSSFRSSQCESQSPMRHIQEITLSREVSYLVIEIQANAFLHHMVRNIVGVLLEIGSNRKSPDWMLQVLNARDRRKAAETAPADGLYLKKVLYPSVFNLPHLPQPYFLL